MCEYYFCTFFRWKYAALSLGPFALNYCTFHQIQCKIKNCARAEWLLELLANKITIFIAEGIFLMESKFISSKCVFCTHFIVFNCRWCCWSFFIYILIVKFSESSIAEFFLIKFLFTKIHICILYGLMIFFLQNYLFILYCNPT